jgi:hypothetical protein
MSDSSKASEDMLHSLHLMTATKIAQMLKEAEGEPELMLKVLREARGFLKDNNVTADVKTNIPLKQVQGEVVKVAELPFEVKEE